MNSPQPLIDQEITATLPRENGASKIIPSNGMKTHISVRNLNISYGTSQILKNVSIDIPDKKITAIIGPSGCGKTTLLKTFNRLIESADGIKIEGEVLVDGENIYGKECRSDADAQEDGIALATTHAASYVHIRQHCLRHAHPWIA
jgi:ABC-type cobalamin/Fe3+-siderophores transport system ATPase subunit